VNVTNTEKPTSFPQRSIDAVRKRFYSAGPWMAYSDIIKPNGIFLI